MAKAVAKPISLKAGQWCIHPCSKGNFVFSFDGCIPFDAIQPYAWLLLALFFEIDQLCPSMGWTCFTVHEVPVWLEDCNIFGPHALLQETKLLLGLKKAVFAMESRWLRSVGSLNHAYLSITFVILDPDGLTTNILINSRSVLFSKDVTVWKWIDKPMLIQCFRCHTLGHNKAFKSCMLDKDSVKCFICGETHRSDKHTVISIALTSNVQHTVAGLCNCKHFKCLNCHKPGHHCRNASCHNRDLYRPKRG